VDAPLGMELITQAAFHATKNIQHVLDIGSGAGSNILKLLQYASSFDSDLVDLSLPLLKKAH
jgi:tRNA (cmo5U34)-methyltransferase